MHVATLKCGATIMSVVTTLRISGHEVQLYHFPNINHTAFAIQGATKAGEHVRQTFILEFVQRLCTIWECSETQYGNTCIVYILSILYVRALSHAYV